MTKEQANEEGRKLYEEWCRRHDEIEAKAKAEGKWINVGLDGNSHLFKELNNEMKQRLAVINAMIDEDTTNA